MNMNRLMPRQVDHWLNCLALGTLVSKMPVVCVGLIPIYILTLGLILLFLCLGMDKREGFYMTACFGQDAIARFVQDATV